MDVKGMRVYENGMSGIPHQNSMIPGTGERQTGFDELLQEKAKVGLNFSKHAAKRLGERGISVDNQLMSARKKGAKDVAIIGAQGVFIVNVPNNMVVTTMGQQDMKERVFTNIDSAVLL